jgi:RNA polymerase sigma factor for flagellar operon FliA
VDTVLAVVLGEQDVERALRIARSFHRKKVPFAEVTDMESAALEGLAQAAHRYEPGNGISFWGYAPRRIYGAMIDELRRFDHLTRDHRYEIRTRDGKPAPVSTYSRPQSLHERISDEEGLSERVDKIPGRSNLDDAEIRDTLIRSSDALNDRERRISFAIHFVGRTQREIAKELGLTEGRVSQIVSNAARKMRMAAGEAA